MPVWAVEQLLDVLLCVAIAPSPEGEDEPESVRVQAHKVPQGEDDS